MRAQQGPLSWEASGALRHRGARGIGGLQLCPVCRGRTLKGLQGGPWQDKNFPAGSAVWSGDAPSPDRLWAKPTTSLPARRQSSPASAPRGAKSDSPLPENNKPVFHDPFSGRPPRGTEGLSKAGPAAPALPRPLQGSPAPETAVPSWGMTSTMTFIHHTEAPLAPGTHPRPLSSPCNSGLTARPSLRAPRRDHAALSPPRQSRPSPVTSLQAPPRPARPARGLVPLAGLGPLATVHGAQAFRPRRNTHATLRRTRTSGHVWPCLALSVVSPAPQQPVRPLLPSTQFNREGWRWSGADFWTELLRPQPGPPLPAV